MSGDKINQGAVTVHTAIDAVAVDNGQSCFWQLLHCHRRAQDT